VTRERFAAWLKGAAVGEEVCYHEGELARAATSGAAAYEAACRGEVFLYQRRLGPGCFAYMARRVDLKTGQLIKPQRTVT
jgi:hypothetical protein